MARVWRCEPASLRACERTRPDMNCYASSVRAYGAGGSAEIQVESEDIYERDL